jgi:RNA polymerase sigma-70 factor, ECF subfamily
LWARLLRSWGVELMLSEDTRRVHRELEERIRPFVARRVPSPDVEDVLQEVFLRIERSLPSLRDEERFTPWIYRVAWSAIVDSHRQRSRSPLLSNDELAETSGEIDALDPTPLEQELASYVVSFIAKLPSPYREALTLTELEGLTQRAAADALGISLSGMKSRVQRGREKLRELLEACCRIAVDTRGRVIDCEPRDPSDCRCRNS